MCVSHDYLRRLTAHDPKPNKTYDGDQRRDQLRHILHVEKECFDCFCKTQGEFPLCLTCEQAANK